MCRMCRSEEWVLLSLLLVLVGKWDERVNKDGRRGGGRIEAHTDTHTHKHWRRIVKGGNLMVDNTCTIALFRYLLYSGVGK